MGEQVVGEIKVSLRRGYLQQRKSKRRRRIRKQGARKTGCELCEPTRLSVGRMGKVGRVGGVGSNAPCRPHTPERRWPAPAEHNSRAQQRSTTAEQNSDGRRRGEEGRGEERRERVSARYTCGIQGAARALNKRTSQHIPSNQRIPLSPSPSFAPLATLFPPAASSRTCFDLSSSESESSGFPYNAVTTPMPATSCGVSADTDRGADEGPRRASGIRSADGHCPSFCDPMV